MIARKTQKSFCSSESDKICNRMKRSIYFFFHPCYTIGYRDQIKNWIISVLILTNGQRKKKEKRFFFHKVSLFALRHGEHRARSSNVKCLHFLVLDVRSKWIIIISFNLLGFTALLGNKNILSAPLPASIDTTLLL